METKKSLSTIQSSNVYRSGSVSPTARIDIREHYDEALPQNRWEVNYGPKDRFFMTDSEHQYFLQKLREGSEIIQVGLLTLTKRFNFIVPLKNKPKQTQFVEVKKEDGSVTYQRL